MLVTETRKALIGDWNPPNKNLQREEELKATTDRDAVQTAVKVVRDGESVIIGGISYQRCGGGRRVIRKRIGSS